MDAQLKRGEVDVGRLFFILLIVGGIVGLKLTAG
jgi:multidrug transporter EmrE-like cation transporter